MEGDDWAAQADHTLVHDPWPYEVQPRLVLRTPQEEVQTDESWWFDRLGRGRE